MGASRVPPRSLKGCSFLRSPEIYNYDLKGAQANILSHELALSGLRSPWLKSYIDSPDAKYFYAKQVGIPVGLWKDCFYALIMGAQADNEHGTVYLNLKRHFKGNLKATKRAHDRFLELVDELITVTKEWRNYIYCSNDRRYFYRHRGLKHWKNQCGMRFKEYGVRDDSNTHVLVDMEKNKVVTAERTIKKCNPSSWIFLILGVKFL